MEVFSAAAIPRADLVKGSLYAILLIGKNVWCYGVYNGHDGTLVNDTMLMPLEYRYNSATQASVWMARTGPDLFDVCEVLFFPITHNVETMVNGWREADRLRGWEEDGVGFLEIVPIRHIGWTLMKHLRERAWARRMHAVTAWAARQAALLEAETADA